MRTALKSIFVVLALLPASASAKPLFAPYVDMAGYPPPALAQWSKASGTRHFTLGFVTAKTNTECVPTWGGYAEYPAVGATPYRRADAKAVSIVVSFGGAAGVELAAVCSEDQLEAAYAAVADAYGATRLDFDIEGKATQDVAANARRARALAALQAKRPGLKIGYTLAVEPNGLLADGRAVLRGAKTAGVKIGLVNIMAMDYGDGAVPNPAGKMGALAIRAAEATRRQLGTTYRKLSVTPMIGINDVPAEIFTLKDARKLHTWARKHKLGGLAMWQAGRDSQCAQPMTTTAEHCSGVAQSAWAFSRALR